MSSYYNPVGTNFVQLMSYLGPIQGVVMRDPFENSNEHIYQLVRANLKGAIKGAVFIDSPGFITHKIDQFYIHSHGLGHYKFLEALNLKLEDLEADFNHAIPEFVKLTETIQGLKIFIQDKIPKDL